jgi:hypothetical protein
LEQPASVQGFSLEQQHSLARSAILSFGEHHSMFDAQRNLYLISVSVFLLTPLAGDSAHAQTATATGTGVGISRSTSTSRATAIGGGQGIGTGGSSSVTINSPAIPTSTVSTVNNTGTQTIRNVPTEFAPGLAAAGLETCLGSISGGGAFVGTGFSFGSTIPDPGCAARLDARTLWSFGLKKAAVARLCLNSDIYRAMPEVCYQYLPQAQPASYYAYARVEDYKGGPILLMDGKTGKDRLCNNYDVVHTRCRVWADAVHHSRSASKLALSGEVPKSAAQPVPVETENSKDTTP